MNRVRRREADARNAAPNLCDVDTCIRDGKPLMISQRSGVECSALRGEASEAGGAGRGAPGRGPATAPAPLVSYYVLQRFTAPAYTVKSGIRNTAFYSYSV